MATISEEFAKTYGITGIEPTFSIIREFRKLGEGIVFQECEGYGFIGLAYDGITHSAIFILDYNKPHFTLVDINKLDEFFLTNILPNT